MAELCLALDGGGREGLAAQAQALYERHSEGKWTRPVPRAAQTARFGLGPSLPAEGFEPFEPPDTHLLALVLARPREWRDAYARWCVRLGHRDSIRTWAALRALVREGACTPPDRAATTRLMLAAARDLARVSAWLASDPASEADLRAWGRAMPPPYPDVVSLLRADPDEAWTPFDLEDYERAPEWERGIVALAAQGTIERDRLIARTIAVLDAKPWRTFHDKVLEPTRAEITRHRDAYLRLLESDDNAVVAFAREQLAEPAAPAPEPAPPRTVASGPAVPVPRPALIDADADAVPRLLTHTRIEAVSGVEELLELAARLLDGDDDPDEFERFLDGIARLCDVPVDPAARRALLPRARRRQALAVAHTERLICLWLDPADDTTIDVFGAPGPAEALGRRLTALGVRVRRRDADLLLSAPTHRGGWLDRNALRARAPARTHNRRSRPRAGPAAAAARHR